MSRRECMPRYSRQLHTRRVHDLIKISESRRINIILYLQSYSHCEQPVRLRGSEEDNGDWQ